MRKTIVILALVAQAPGCGDDGIKPCTQNCEVPGSTTVEWLFNHYPEWGFESDSCTDLGVFNVRVEALGIDDPSIYEVAEPQCGAGQATFVGLPPGTYAIAVTPLDSELVPIVNAAAMGETLAGTTGADTKITINVPHTAWTQTYTGQFLFRLSWGGASCELAMPEAVALQTLKLTAGGRVVTARSDSEQLMNGTDPKPCRPLSEQFAQYVAALPFGPATLEVIGTRAGGEVGFEQTFDTFVGAGIFNPTITFDVAPIEDPDPEPDPP